MYTRLTPALERDRAEWNVEKRHGSPARAPRLALSKCSHRRPQWPRGTHDRDLAGLRAGGKPQNSCRYLFITLAIAMTILPAADDLAEAPERNHFAATRGFSVSGLCSNAKNGTPLP